MPHVTPYVVGDLSIEEAEDYFEKHVLPQHGMSHQFIHTEYLNNGIFLSK
jgi:predicted amidohydrolase YtcJ